MPALSSQRTIERRVTRVAGGRIAGFDDLVAAEEPLEIRLLWQAGSRVERKSIAVTMRTPGDDFELAAGFLFGESVIHSADEIADVSYCLDEDETQNLNIDPARLERNFFTTSSCGVCGKATLEALELQGCAALPDGPAVPAETLTTLPGKLREAQAVFEKTGGLHAAGLFDIEGNLLAMREDVGRHNAVDKLIGSRILSASPPLYGAGHGAVLMLSGRAGFELLQKALVAGIPIVASVGAPSSLAVELAESFNITLAGFVRPEGFNVYSAPGRIAGAAS
jgi:FdhD protein